MACGCADGGIRAWSLETCGLERTLWGDNEEHVSALVVSGRRLISSSCDRMLRVWSTETWGCVQTVEAYPAGSRRYIDALAVCGWPATLAGGSNSGSGSVDHEVRVWDLETLRPLHTLRQPAGADVRSLVWDGREVWRAVGSQVAVWGRRGVTGSGA